MIDLSILAKFAPLGMEMLKKIRDALSKKDNNPNPIEVRLITQQNSLEDIREFCMTQQKSIDELKKQFNQTSKRVQLYGILFLFVLVIGFTALILTN